LTLGQQSLVTIIGRGAARVVSFINVVDCGTLPSIGIRQNLRYVIESLTSRHKLSSPVDGA
jgi:hypothetical protein